MKKYSLLFICLILPLSVSAQKLCGRTSQDIANFLLDPTSRIGIRNTGGLFNGGVCWWHSRLQRSSAYLAKYNPAKARPTSAMALSILTALRNMNQTVEIPGYENFNEFTIAHRAEVQKMLDDWQKYDGFFNSEWRRGISGKSSLPAAEMEERVKNVYGFVKSSPVPVWIMAQMKGISSHAFLILQMDELPKGYDLTVIDSNAPLKSYVLHYQFGDEFISHPDGKMTFVPYVGFQNDFKLIGETLKKFCRPKLMDEFDSVQMGDIELGKEEHAE